MAAPKKSVDEIWKELNARTVPPRSRTTGITGFGIPGVQTHTRIVAKDHPSVSQQHVAGDISVSRDVPKPSVAYDPAAAGVPQEQLQQYISTLQRTLNCLTDPDRSIRREAVTSLHSKLLRGDAVTPKASPEMLQVSPTEVAVWSDWPCLSNPAWSFCCSNLQVYYTYSYEIIPLNCVLLPLLRWAPSC